jgi:hypothetical protein
MKPFIAVLLFVSFLFASEIVVQDTVALKTIDSITSKQDSISKLVYKNKHFKSMKDGTVPEQVEYLKSLIKTGYETNLSISKCVSALLVIATLEYDKLWVILNTQEDYERLAVNRHRQSIKKDMQSLEEYFESIHPEETPRIELAKKTFTIKVRDK